MSFIATANPPIEAEDAQVENDPWFPAIEAPKVREACLLDGTVTAARLAEAIESAIDTVNGELRSYMAEQIALGAASLGVAGDGRQAGRYLRAIHAHVQADLAEAYRETDTTPHNDSKTERIRERIEAKVDEHRRKLRWAISDLLGRPRTTVELI
ncbi:head completion/stabilization protein [Acidovorax sp. LjRoot38]|uniref:head completion/stabilization protein n=1 Tax=Acidovorax sp. LjRoot38 TaxID=3342327 RepID=UPI003ED15070